MRLNLDFTACSSLLAMKNKVLVNLIIQRNVFLLVWWVNYGGLYIKKPRKKKERGRGLFDMESVEAEMVMVIRKVRGNENREIMVCYTTIGPSFIEVNIIILLHLSRHLYFHSPYIPFL